MCIFLPEWEDTVLKKKEKKNGKTSGFSRLVFRVVRRLVQLFYPKIAVVGEENLPSDGCIIVGNHTQMNGPICGELYVPGNRRIWCNYQMMELAEVPAYAFQDFWSKKPEATRWFYKLLSYIIAPLSVAIFNNAYTIPVYHDMRLITTFKQTIAHLEEDTRIVIFPECIEPHNHIVNKFQDKFVDVAKLYHKRSGKAVSFVPMYIAPRLKTLYFGKPTVFDPDAEISSERARICEHLMNEITSIATSLPEHIVVPYENKPKKEYNTNLTVPQESKK